MRLFQNLRCLDLLKIRNRRTYNYMNDLKVKYNHKIWHYKQTLFTVSIICLLIINNSLIIQAQSAVKDTDYECRLNRYVHILSDDYMEGRGAGSYGCEKAAEWIKHTFKSIGLHNCDTCIFSQKIKLLTNEGDTAFSENILGYVFGNSNKWIIIVAHYDHIGYGGKYSRSPLKKLIHNGADDNASGVAILLEISDRLTQIKTKYYNYMFVALTGHETGLWGSKYLAQNSIINHNNINLIINLDMLGRLDEDKQTLIVYSSGESLFSEIETKQNNNFNFIRKKYIEGDHSIFEDYEIPVVFISTGVHNDYHTINDKPNLINYKGMIKIADFLLETLIEK